MDKCPSHYDSRVLELLSLFGLSVGDSAHVEQDYHWLAAIASLPPPKRSSVIVFLNFVLQEIGKNVLEEIGFMLAIDVRHVSEYSLKVWYGFLFEIFV